MLLIHPTIDDHVAEFPAPIVLLIPAQINPYGALVLTTLFDHPTTEFEPSAALLADIICADCGDPAPYSHGPVGPPPPPRVHNKTTSPALLSPNTCPALPARHEKRSHNVPGRYHQPISIVFPGLFCPNQKSHNELLKYISAYHQLPYILR